MASFLKQTKPACTALDFCLLPCQSEAFFICQHRIQSIGLGENTLWDQLTWLAMEDGPWIKMYSLLNMGFASQPSSFRKGYTVNRYTYRIPIVKYYYGWTSRVQRLYVMVNQNPESTSWVWYFVGWLKRPMFYTSRWAKGAGTYRSYLKVLFTTQHIYIYIHAS